MKKEEVKEILKKCFGKNKDEKYHARAMLVIYGIFIVLVVLMVRLGGSSTPALDSDNASSTSPITSPTTENENTDTDEDTIISGDINYSYSYTISHNGTTEVYLGKKIDNKEKFTLIKDGISTDYAILSDNYLILENGSYHITTNPSSYLKYCDVEKILLLVENEIPTQNNNLIKYNISNSILATNYNETILVDNHQNNLIQLTMVEEELKTIELDFSNLFSSITGEGQTFTIKMEFVDVGTTENFEITVS